MMLGPFLLCCLGLLAQGANVHNPATTPPPVTPSPTTTDLEKQIKQLEQVVGGMARQMMLQQLFVEERIRTEGDSGVKQVRMGSDAMKPYQTNTFTGGSINSIHDHSNYDRTVGMGEVAAVMNGVDFRTRHNDYKLMMPDPHSKTYHKLVEVPFPDVPPSVKSMHPVAEQITEMQQYFKAFKMQDPRIRNYEPYFKPVLCYMEGAWTTDTKTLTEPFHSDRHFIDASSWMELQEKVRFTSYTGGKSVNENFSYLPTTIFNVTEDGTPVYAQWSYRIVCHPIKEKMHLYDFKLIDDFATRMHLRKNFTAYGNTRAARFMLRNIDRKGQYYSDRGYGNFNDVSYRYGLLDKIMAEIPGKDNYQGYLTDDSFDEMKLSIATKNSTNLNTAFYHRWFKSNRKGAMGLTVRHRGYADSNLWTAQTTQPQVAEMSVTDCPYDSHLHKKVCKSFGKRYTYAIPLEIIWLTPLSQWNPYNLKIHDLKHRNDVTAHGRNGGFDSAHAFNGTSFNAYYLTPNDFFHGDEVNRDPADTAKNAVGVLDQHGKVQKVVASGTRVFLPEIPGIGKLRMRYPITPTHVEGSVAWKGLTALQDVVMDMKRYTNMFEARPEVKDLDAHPADAHYITSTTHDTKVGMHHHDLYVTVEELQALHSSNSTTVHVFTSENNGHQHEMELQVNPDPRKSGLLEVVSCDGQPRCFDHHSHVVYLQRD